MSGRVFSMFNAFPVSRSPPELALLGFARRQRTRVIANPTDVTAKPTAKLTAATASSALRLPCVTQASTLWASMKRNATQSAPCMTKYQSELPGGGAFVGASSAD